jgi:hypothetical protein
MSQNVIHFYMPLANFRQAGRIRMLHLELFSICSSSCSSGNGSNSTAITTNHDNNS